MSTKSKLEAAVQSLEFQAQELEKEVMALKATLSQKALENDTLQKKKRELQQDYQRLRQTVKSYEQLLGSIKKFQDRSVDDVCVNTMESLLLACQKCCLEEQMVSHLSVQEATKDYFERKCKIERDRIDDNAYLEPLVHERDELKVALSRQIDHSGPPTPNPRRSSCDGNDHTAMTRSETPSQPMSVSEPDQRSPFTQRLSARFRMEVLFDVRSEQSELKKQVASLQKENTDLRKEAEYETETIHYILEKMYSSLEPEDSRKSGLMSGFVRFANAQKTKDTRFETLFQDRKLIENALERRMELQEALSTLRENLGVENV